MADVPLKPRDRGLLGGLFGIGVGRMRILLPDMEFSPGDMLVGKLLLDLTTPVMTNEITVWIQAEKTEHSPFTRTTTERTWTGRKRVLAGPGQYQYEEFDFGLPVFEGPGAGWGHAMADFLLNSPRWTVQARLDTPEVSIGISTSRSFTVSR